MSEESRSSLWHELKERKVVRVTAVYAAVAWGVVMGGSELSQILELPAWVPKLVLALAVLGFPVALVLAWAFEVTPDGVRRAEPLASANADRPSRLPFFAGVAVGISAISLVAFLVREDGGTPAIGAPGDRSTEGGLDAELVAIIPFRYSGPADLSYLGEGVFQLLAARFTGEIGPRATDPTATAAVWDEAATIDPTTATRTVAERLGAGLVLTGGVVAGPDGLNLSASLRDVTTDEEVASASAQGPPEELTEVVERLAGGILSLSVGEYRESLEQLTSADPEALREYLLGQVEFRQARWINARAHFERAVEADSTFALAAIWTADAGNNVPGAATQRYLRLAWRHQERLTERDRLYLRARLGPGHPGTETRDERRRAYEEAARAAPERANIWYFLGEATVHFPRSSEDYDRALQYFRRAVELDPTNVNAILHLGITHHVRGDIPGIVEVHERMAALDTTHATQLQSRLVGALAERDSATAVALYDSIAALPTAFLFMAGVPFDSPALLVADWQIDPIVRTIESRRAKTTPSDEFAMSWYFYFYYSYQDLGLAERANGVLTEFERARGTRYDRMRLFDAMYGALPESAGQAAADRMEAELEAVPEAEWDSEWAAQLAAVEMWRIEHDDLSRVTETTRRIRSVAGRVSEPNASAGEGAALLLEAMAQARRGDPEARATIEAFDALFLRGLPYGVELYDAMVLATADVYDRLGDPAAALRALERESNNNNFRWPYGARFARERGRLAALTGDTARAIREYEYYTTLRSQAELGLRAELEQVRGELERLRGG